MAGLLTEPPTLFLNDYLPTRRHAAFIIQDLDTLKTMADARRMQILEVVLNQTATVKEIAEQLNQPARQLYYHINTLEKHGLIRVIDTRIVSGIIKKCTARPRSRMSKARFQEFRTQLQKSFTRVHRNYTGMKPVV